jgi:transposase InsO family protein
VIARWCRQTIVPVNRYSDFVAYLVQRLRVLCPTMGRRRIADVLARAGLHLGPSTVRRMSHDTGRPDDPEAATARRRQLVAKAPNHVWSLDLTTLLGRAMTSTGARPRHVLTDRGTQFHSREFRARCRRRDIRPRYGAVGRPRSIAIVERLTRSLKDECTRRFVLPMRPGRLRRELALYAHWYDRHRPHQGLGGRTPDEVYFGRVPANERPHHEPRAAPEAEIRGHRGAVLRLDVSYL